MHPKMQRDKRAVRGDRERACATQWQRGIDETHEATRPAPKFQQLLVLLLDSNAVTKNAPAY